jgi:hypothetical protein
MPQFRPFWWINILSWIAVFFSFLIWYNQTIFLPKILKKLLLRLKLS